ncbi:MAG: Tim44-like domain-containing protein [Gemmataceae bacterium]
MLSKPPGRWSQANNCPNCGAGLELGADGACKYCQTVVKAGMLDWGVEGIQLIGREERGPQLTTNVEDVGLDRPTIYQENLGAARTHFLQVDPNFSAATFRERVTYIFHSLQAAWTSRKWDGARPFETDAIFQTHRYWIEAYRAQNLRNVLDQIKVEKIELVRFGKDAFYDSITCRIFASMVDYVEDAEGKVLRGSKTKPTRFSEYWTFIRSRRSKTKQSENQNCPNCGAPLKVSMAGECEYCRSKITNGDFDWVLSRIEQDEAYSG